MISMSTSDTHRSIDSIVFTAQAKTWLCKHEIMPSTWNLHHDEYDRILSAGLALTIFNTPACTIPLADVQQRIPNLQNLILIDSRCIDGPDDKGLLAREEVIATLLHEIGHVVNPAPTTDAYNEEGWADDYARHCGYEASLVIALSKLRASGDSESLNGQMQLRIDRIQRGTKINTRW
jgi:hypothetical protein